MNASHRGMLALTLGVFLLVCGTSGQLDSYFGASKDGSGISFFSAYEAGAKDELKDKAAASFAMDRVILSRSTFASGDLSMKEDITAYGPYGTAEASFKVRNATEISHSWLYDPDETDDTAFAGQLLTARNASLISASAVARHISGAWAQASIDVKNGSLEDYSSWASTGPYETAAGQMIAGARGESIFIDNSAAGRNGTYATENIEVLDGSVQSYGGGARDGSYPGTMAVQFIGGAGVWYDEGGDLHVEPAATIATSGIAANAGGDVSGTCTIVNGGSLNGYSGESRSHDSSTSSDQSISLPEAAASGGEVIIASQTAGAGGRSSMAYLNIINGSVGGFESSSATGGSHDTTSISIGEYWEPEYDPITGDAKGDIVTIGAWGWDGENTEAGSQTDIYGGSIDLYSAKAHAGNKHVNASQDIGGYNYGSLLHRGAVGDGIEIQNVYTRQGEDNISAKTGISIANGSVITYKGYVDGGYFGRKDHIAFSGQSLGADPNEYSQDGIFRGGAGDSITTWSEGRALFSDGSFDGYAQSQMQVTNGSINGITSGTEASKKWISASHYIRGSADAPSARGDRIISKSSFNSTSEDILIGTELEVIGGSIGDYANSAGYSGSFRDGRYVHPAKVSAGQGTMEDSFISGDEIRAETFAVRGSEERLTGYIGAENASLSGFSSGILFYPGCRGSMILNQNISGQGDRISSSASASLGEEINAEAHMNIYDGLVDGYRNSAQIDRCSVSAGQMAPYARGESVLLGWSGMNTEEGSVSGELFVANGSIGSPEIGDTDTSNGSIQDVLVKGCTVKGDQSVGIFEGDRVTATLYAIDRQGDWSMDDIVLENGSLAYTGSAIVKSSYSQVSSAWEASGGSIDVTTTAGDRMGDLAASGARASTGDSLALASRASGNSLAVSRGASAEAQTEAASRGESAGSWWSATDRYGNHASSATSVTDGAIFAESSALASKCYAQGSQDIVEAEGREVSSSWNASGGGEYGAYGGTAATEASLTGAIAARASSRFAEGSEQIDVHASTLESLDVAGDDSRSSRVYLREIGSLQGQRVHAGFTHIARDDACTASASQVVTNAEGSLEIGGAARSLDKDAWYIVDVVNATELKSTTRVTANSAALVDAGRFSAEGDQIDRGFGASASSVGAARYWVNATDGRLISNNYYAMAAASLVRVSGSWKGTAGSISKSGYALSPSSGTPATLFKVYHGSASASDMATATRRMKKVQ